MSSVETVSVSKNEDGIRLDRWFKRFHPAMPHGRLEKLLRTGQVRIDGSRAKANTRVFEGQVIRVPPIFDKIGAFPKEKSSIKFQEEDVERLKKNVLHMDRHVLVINKPSGLAVQGGSKTSKHLDGMLDTLSFDSNERPRLVHRLDKDTSGVLILARSRKSAKMLSEGFRSKIARKVYWAIVMGVPRPSVGRIDISLAKIAGVGGEKVRAAEDGKRAITNYRVVENAGRKAAWLSLEPLTGRTHQLRVHCNELGTPILGDGKYGGKLSFFEGSSKSSCRLQLHSKAIRIPNPGGGILEVSAPLPDHMAEIWRFLGFNENLAGGLFSEDGIP